MTFEEVKNAEIRKAMESSGEVHDKAIDNIVAMKKVEIQEAESKAQIAIKHEEQRIEQEKLNLEKKRYEAEVAKVKTDMKRFWITTAVGIGTTVLSLAVHDYLVKMTLIYEKDDVIRNPYTKECVRKLSELRPR